MKIFRSDTGALPNTVALAYTLAGYAAGVCLLVADHWGWNALGVLLTAHTLVYAAYFLHEFAHQSVFRTAGANNRWGTLMTWVTGSAYASFANLRRKHMRHHLDRADVVSVEYRQVLQRWPGWLRGLVLALEWAWIPAVEFLMHGYVIALPFLDADHRDGRLRVVLVLAVRSAAFATLAWLSPRALLLYGVAYLLMLHALRFADAYQHTYDAFAGPEGSEIPGDKLRDRAYEQANTYSNLVSAGHPWLNLLLLNFSYHNAHHERPIAAWHELPALHEQLFPGAYRQVIPMRELLRGYHRDRVRRVLASDYGEVGDGPGKADRFLGAVGVSFLTAV